MIKLMDKPLKAFTTYALVVLLSSIPVYFLIVDLIWVHEINEHNQIVAEATKKNLTQLNLDETKMNFTISLWNSLHPETKILKVEELKSDSIYNMYRKDGYNAEGGYDRFQGLVTYFEVDHKRYSLTVEANVEESYETIVAITAVTIVFFIILLVGFIKLNKRISQKLWSPFYKTLEQIKAFDLSNHRKIVFEKSNIMEFEELNESICKLVDSNVEVFWQQKEFTENASHELQTPLAIIQSKLDMLLQDGAVTQEQSQIIEGANNAVLRVSRINKNLLLLAKIENQQFSDRQMINVAEPLQDILDLLSGLLDGRIIKCDIDATCKVEGNPMLVEIMITNLLMNALRHTEAGAKILITLSAKELLIANTGAFALDDKKLFRRFSAASNHTRGSGLGLSIVKKICNRYGWTVGYTFNQQMHIFRLVLR